MLAGWLTGWYWALIRGVIFDLGGVVVRWRNSVSYREIEERFGIASEKARLYLEHDMPLVQVGALAEDEWLRGLFASRGLEPPFGFERIWLETFRGVEFEDEMIGLVKTLRRRYVVAALSNIEGSRADYLRSLGIEAMFDRTFFSSDLGLRKPDTGYASMADLQIYRIVLQEIGLQAQQCAYTDDNEFCVQAAEETGIHSILFNGLEDLGNRLRGLGVAT